MAAEAVAKRVATVAMALAVRVARLLVAQQMVQVALVVADLVVRLLRVVRVIMVELVAQLAVLVVDILLALQVRPPAGAEVVRKLMKTSTIQPNLGLRAAAEAAVVIQLVPSFRPLDQAPALF